MTPREELLAAVAKLDRHVAFQATAPGYSKYAEPETRIIRAWLQLEADQHWHIPYVDSDQVTNKWDLVYKPEWIAMQPCIQMARLINGTEES